MSRPPAPPASPPLDSAGRNGDTDARPAGARSGKGKAATPDRYRHRRARRVALQAIYQWQANHASASALIAQFAPDLDEASVNRELFDALVTGVVRHIDSLDETLAPFLDRPMAQLDAVARAILRLGTLELVHHPEVPWRVVIAESVDLAHTFGAESSHRFVNAVLDRMARELRKGEVAASRPPRTGG